jgi:diguanylate cyclase (GGDEF)-like protein
MQYISLRKRLVILLVVMILPFITFSVFKAIDIKDNLEQQYQLETLALANNVAHDLDDYINATGEALIPIAANKDVRMQNYPAVKAYLEGVVPKYPFYHLIAFVDLKGDAKVAVMSAAMANSEDARKLASISVKDTACYRRGIVSNGVAVGDFMYSKLTKMPVVHVTYPVFDMSGKRIGFVAAAFDLTKIQNKLMRTGTNKSTILSIVDDKGVYIARSKNPEQWVGHNIANSDRFRKMVNKKSGFYEAKSGEGTLRMFGFTQASLVNWYARAGIDKTYIRNQATNEIAHNFLVFLPLLLVAVFGWLWIGRDVDTLHKKTEELSLTDPLTGLWNCRKLHQDLVSAFTRAKRYRDILSFAMIDIDHFKEYNDHNGHQLGDEALVSVSSIIRNALRDCDSVYRYGGEELCVLLPSTDKASALAVAERIRYDVEHAIFTGEDHQPSGRLTISIGVATYPFDSIAKESLINAADIALYEAKDNGRNHVQGYDDTSPHIHRHKDHRPIGICI